MHGTFFCDFPGFPRFPELMGTDSLNLVSNTYYVRTFMFGSMWLWKMADEVYYLKRYSKFVQKLVKDILSSLK